MNQKDAVFNAVVSVLGSTPTEAVQLTAEQRAEVIDAVAAGLADSSIDFTEESRAKYSDEASIRRYTAGLISNYLRRDPRLSGGVKHVATPKGPRTPKDDQLAEMKTLRQKLEAEGNQDGVTEVNEAIEARTAELRAAKEQSKPKTKAVTVDLTKIPDELKESLGIAL